MNVFTQDAFSAMQMTAAVDKLDYVPGLLGSMNAFQPVPVTTEDVFIEERENASALIQTSERGAPPKRKGGEKRKVTPVRNTRIATADRITADQVQGIRAFGAESELQMVTNEVARRQLLLRRDIELTMENMRLGAVQGIVTDADGSILFNWPTLLNQTIPAEIDFDLDAATPASGVVRKKCNEVVRSVLRGLKGLGGGQVQVVGFAGDAFWDDLTAHKEVRETYLGQQEAADLRRGNAFETFSYGNITFVNYRGTDDGSTVAIGADKCKFFPLGAGIFQVAYSPAETFDFVNTPGQALYSWPIIDRDRNAFVDIEMYSYPLHVCTMPQALHRAKRT
jgi:hypothetical protein